ncbi:MAG: hypothetical protein IH594_05805 [Bacteroidales bacterium]|nr:hypothetical protein [Bacteroidales bacterium]
MKKNWLIIISVIAFLAVLYFIEISKVNTESVSDMPALDKLQTNEIGKNWESFYRVRATIIDGQSASFSIPNELKNKEGKEIELAGAIVFFGNGCKIINDSTTEVYSFFLLPSLGLAQACVLQPDVAMRWTIRVNLALPWILSRNEMIDTEASVSGVLRIDTSKPYEAAFILENSSAELRPDHD